MMALYNYINLKDKQILTNKSSRRLLAHLPLHNHQHM